MIRRPAMMRRYARCASILLCGIIAHLQANSQPQATPAVASVFVTSFNLVGADALPPGLLDPYLSEHTMQKKTLVELRKLAAQLEKRERWFERTP